MRRISASRDVTIAAPAPGAALSARMSWTVAASCGFARTSSAGTWITVGSESISTFGVAAPNRNAPATNAVVGPSPPKRTGSCCPGPGHTDGPSGCTACGPGPGSRNVSSGMRGSRTTSPAPSATGPCSTSSTAAPSAMT